MAAGAMKLFVHTGDEYADSIDPESLQVLTYLRLLGSNSTSIDIIRTCKYWKSPSSTFPALVANGKVYSGAENVITQLKKQGLNLDDRILSDEEEAEVTALTSLLQDRLKLALLYIHWSDGKNYTEVTRKWYSKAAYFPIPLFILSQQHRYVEYKLITELPQETSNDHRGLVLLDRAEECLNMLSVRLKDKEYFCGKNPSSFDAFVFGYLELIAQYQLPSKNRLQFHLNSLMNLSKFCERMRKLAFPETKTRPISSAIYSSSVPLWKDPTVWACVIVGGAVLVLQGYRVGLFRRIMNGERWWPIKTRNDTHEDLSEFN